MSLIIVYNSFLFLVFCLYNSSVAYQQPMLQYELLCMATKSPWSIYRSRASLLFYCFFLSSKHQNTGQKHTKSSTQYMYAHSTEKEAASILITGSRNTHTESWMGQVLNKCTGYIVVALGYMGFDQALVIYTPCFSKYPSNPPFCLRLPITFLIKKHTHFCFSEVSFQNTRNVAF